VLKNMETIIMLAALDQQQGHTAWGRAGRISRKLGGSKKDGGLLGERQVKRYLDRLSEMSELGTYGASRRSRSKEGRPPCD
jgi:hypothetical protein